MGHGFGIHGIELDLAIAYVGRQLGIPLHLGRTEEGGQHVVVQCQQFAQFGGKTARVFQILHAQSAAGDFVFIGRADATACGTDFGRTGFFFGSFAGNVDGSMERQDEWAAFAHAQAGTHIDTGFFKARDFFKQFADRQHHAVADIALDTGAHDATGNQVQRGFHAIDHQRMTGVVAALKAHHACGGFGQPIDQLAFAFVTPLGTDHDHVAAGNRR